MNRVKKPWLQQMISEGKIKPSLMPQDFFFQYKKNQPYQLKKTFDEDFKQKIYFAKKSKCGNFKTFDEAKIIRARARSSLDMIDKKSKFKKNAEAKIKNKKTKLSNEIRGIFLKDSRNSINQFFIDELKNNREDYRKISDRITILTLRKSSN